MEFQKEYLDLVLVPGGLLIMFVYHLFFLYRYLHQPQSTVMGFENSFKKDWVDKIMSVPENKKLDTISHALAVVTTNISATTYLAMICLTICSLIGAWIANTDKNLFQSDIIYGDTKSSTMSIKYICLLSCFLLAFSFFIQSARNFVHANYLLTTPDCEHQYKGYVELAVRRGGEYWSLGLRALYFALNLLLWFFGPIPMFVSSIVIVGVLHYLDRNSVGEKSSEKSLSC